MGDGQPAGNDAIGLLDSAMTGRYRFVCTQYCIVQNAVMNAYGYLTRFMGSGTGGLYGVKDGHHGINEIWSNQYRKWFLSDVMFDHHFEKDGIPLSALEVRDEFLKNKGADVYRSIGPDRQLVRWDTSIVYTGLELAKSPAYYAWVESNAYDNRFTAYPNKVPLLLYMYADDYFNTHTWIWDGKPHWAYSTAYLQTIPQREYLEWTPGVLDVNTSIDGNSASISIATSMPNFKEFQIQDTESGSPWDPMRASAVLPLSKPHHEWNLRAVNLAGVCGPVYRLVIQAEGRILPRKVKTGNRLQIRPIRLSEHGWHTAVDLAAAGEFSLRIFDAAGKLAWSYRGESQRPGTCHVPVPRQAPGLEPLGANYVAVLQNCGQRAVRKLGVF
jgi:hypothetical protein